jgi:hypothetical protein
MKPGHNQREELFKKLIEIDLVVSTNEVKYPKLMLKSFFLNKKESGEQVDIFKGLSFEKFYDIIEYSEDDMENWLVDYSIKNKDIEEYLWNIYIDLIGL